jgi:competence ComEA-like helix-hairpin-helix protein
MSRTTLRDYIHEIENLIETGQFEEAIAHGSQVLQVYPKHLAANRLLGKVHLELQHDQEASASFQQVLEAVPDDAVAHLGLSVIREHEGDLDSSIRHMERAFDVQPANATIQGELRRLYKERDGFEPQKIHLTRGALARMYAKGDLYTQAISELRAALGEDPQRPDLQIVLAKMYAKSGQLLEAAETCTTLLNKLPDCLEAHLILGDILYRTDRSAEAQAHYQRAAALDPYAAHISTGGQDPEFVLAETVMLDRFDFIPSEPITAGEPAGQDREEPVAESPVGESQQYEQTEEVGMDEEAREPGELPVEPPEADETPGEVIPDWMQSAGWEPARESGEEPVLELEGEAEEIAEEEEELVKAEIPDWLKPLAPSEAEESIMLGSEELEGAEASVPWSAESTASDFQSSETTTQGEAEEELPDWMKAAEEVQAEPEAETPEWMKAAEEVQPEPEGEETGWLGDSEKEQPEPEGELPDWLKAEEEEPEAEMPDWLIAAKEERSGLEAETPDWMIAAEEEQLEPEAEVPDWLKSAEGEQVEPAEEVPGWLEEIEPEIAAAGPDEPAQEAGWSTDEGVPRAEAATGFSGEQASDLPDWMHLTGEELPIEPELTTGEPSWEPSGETGEPADDQDIPEWLRSLGEAGEGEESEMPGEEFEKPFLPQTEEPAESEVPSSGSEVPDWLRTALEEQEGSQAEQHADIPDWLRSSIPEGFPEEPPPIEGDTKPVRPRAIEEQPVEEQVEEVFDIQPAVEEGVEGSYESQAPTELPEIEEAGAWAEPEEEIGEKPLETTFAEISTEAEVFDSQQEEAALSEEAGETGVEMGEEAAAMGWLESLAAREGAQEEELLTRPEERSEEIPEWLQKLSADTDVEAEEVSEEAAKVVHAEMEEAAWQPEMEAETESAIEQAAETEAMETEEPTWQPELEAETEGAIELAAEIEAMDTEGPTWQPEMEAETEGAIEQAAETEALDTEGPTWQPEIEAEAGMQAEPAAAAQSEAELPDWLRDFVEEDAGAAVQEEVLDEEIAAPLLEPLDLNTATLAELERIPEIGFIQAQNIVNYRETHGPLNSREDLENVPGISPEVVNRFEEWGAFEHPAEISPQAEETQEVLPEVETSGGHPALAQAWGKLVEGEVSTAIDLYSDLIRKEQHLDQVIHELREAAFLYPQEISLHQALGDAYLRANRLQEALDAYNKAEDLLK